ncbi:hypothetical protein [Thermococcus sp. 2319x1]|nr:hypothetical protein [Thermococcus sp. 2319x1]
MSYLLKHGIKATFISEEIDEDDVLLDVLEIEDYSWQLDRGYQR